MSPSSSPTDDDRLEVTTARCDHGSEPSRRPLFVELLDLFAVEGRGVDGPGVVAGEQHPGESGLPGLRRGQPPDRRVVTGSGERHIQHAQVGPHRLMGRPAAAVGQRLVGPPLEIRGQINDALAARVIPPDVVVGRGSRRIPRGGGAHHREFKALGDEGGHDLHGAGLGLDPAGREIGLGVAVLVGARKLLEGGQQRGRTRVGATRQRQQLGDVLEVGHGPVAVGPAQHA